MGPELNSSHYKAALLAQADMLFRTERYREAEEILRRWLMANPGSSVEVQAVLSQAISHQPGRYTEALTEAHRAIAQDPSAAIGYYVLALILADGDSKGALAALDDALRCAPDLPAFYALRARIYLRMKQPKQALEAIEVARRLDPENVECIQIHGVALLHNGKAKQAREVINAGLRLDPEDAPVHNAMGWALLRLGESDLARLHFTQALRLKPRMQNAREGLSHALKARYPFYKLIFGYFQWLQGINRLPPVKRVAVIALMLTGLMIIFTLAFTVILVSLSYVSINLVWIGLGAGLLLFAMLIGAPISIHFFDLFLRFDPFGRLTLTKEQIWLSNWMIAGLICAMIGLGEAVISGSGMNGLGLFLAGMMVSGLVIGWPGMK